MSFWWLLVVPASLLYTYIGGRSYARFCRWWSEPLLRTAREIHQKQGYRSYDVEYHERRAEAVRYQSIKAAICWPLTFLWLTTFTVFRTTAHLGIAPYRAVATAGTRKRRTQETAEEDRSKRIRALEEELGLIDPDAKLLPRFMERGDR